MNDMSSEAPKTTETTELRHIKSTKVERVDNKRSLETKDEANKVKTSTGTPNFRVTPYMNVWVNTAVKLITDSPEEISKDCGLDRTNWYKWCKKFPAFEQWFYDQYKAHRGRWIPRLDRIGMMRAPKNFDYWQAMNQKAGELLDGEESQPQQRISILGGMTVQTVNNIKQDTTTKQQDT